MVQPPSRFVEAFVGIRARGRGAAREAHRATCTASPPRPRVLGLLVEGVTDIPALGEALHVGTAAVLDALGRSLAVLRTSDLAAATVRALRSGMRIPPGVTGAA